MEGGRADQHAVAVVNEPASRDIVKYRNMDRTLIRDRSRRCRSVESVVVAALVDAVRGERRRAAPRKRPPS